MIHPRPCHTPRCGQPARLYPAGWLCDQHRPAQPAAASPPPVPITLPGAEPRDRAATCQGCGTAMTLIDPGQRFHPLCAPPETEAGEARPA